MTKMIQNSKIIEKVLITLLSIVKRKTTEGYAISVMDSLIKKLEANYDFLRHVEIKDTRFSESEEPVTVMSDVDSIPPSEVGKAIQSIISTMNESLSKDVGHFFIKEISQNIGDEYDSVMKDMGVDLNLMQLEHEVSELEKRMTNISKK
ncbi:MAG: hypothetical protein QHH19_07070 [Candidatus Thermoplasmatota archaeon]|nr:hypothetical protein [Candidatus Thermoplasmatota archaeon]